MRTAQRIILLQSDELLPQTRSFLERASASYSGDQKKKLNTFVKTLVGAGVWDRLDCLYLPGFVSNSTDARLNLIKNAHNCTIAGTPTFVVGEGFKNFTNSNYLNTNYTPSSQAVNYTQNNGCIGFSTMRIPSGVFFTVMEMGCFGTGSVLNSNINLLSGSGLRARLNQGAAQVSRAESASEEGLFAVCRENSTTVKVYQNDIEIISNTAASSVALPDRPFFIGALNQAGAPSFASAATIIDTAFMGAFLTAAQVSALRSAIRTLIPLRTKRKAVFLGDSITVGQAASVYEKRWSSLISLSAGNDFNEINVGISGTVLQNTTPVLASNGRDRYVADVLNKNPEWVYILYGVNDLRYNGASFSDANYQNDLGEIVSGLIAGGINASKIVIGSPSYVDPTKYATFASPYNAGSTPKHQAYRNAALAVAQLHHTRYADVYQAMVDYATPLSLLSVDGLHPNDTGHQLIADTLSSATVQ